MTKQEHDATFVEMRRLAARTYESMGRKDLAEQARALPVPKYDPSFFKRFGR